ncbi:phage terminase large subunit [Candidatus Saccharibacteria bacterium]|nr:phage terminase large subunit [Candidatus Saccharibacteria bacterium]
MAYGKTTSYYEIQKLKKRIKVVQGSSSASKTVSIVLILIDYATRHPDKLISIAGVNMPHLKRGAKRDLKNILTENNYWDYYKIVENKAESTFTFFNGTVIEFLALDEGKARGARRDVLFVNEANLIDYETFNQLEIRTKESIYIDYNPTSEFWAHTELVGVRDDVDFIIVTYKQNEALDEAIVQALERRKHNKNWWRVYGEGQIGELEGLVYSGWTGIDKVPDSAELIGYGLDFGYTNDPTAIVCVYKHEGGYLLDEICYHTGLFNKDIAEMIKQHNLQSVLGVGDSSEPKSIAEISSEGINLIGATKTSQDKGKTYNQWAISKIQEMKIYYTNSSINLRKEYLGYMWASDRTGKKLNVPMDGNDHTLDAMKYRLIQTLAPKVQYDWEVR